MTSVESSNSFERGKRIGYDIGYESALNEARSYGITVRFWKLVLALLIGFLIGVSVADAKTMSVISEAAVTASVPCNPINCPEPTPMIGTGVSTTTIPSETFIDRLWGIVTSWFTAN